MFQYVRTMKIQQPYVRGCQAGCRILCIQFTNSDAFAVGVVLDGTGQEIAVKFWKGGNEYSHHCRKLLEKIQKSQEATGGRQTGRVDQKYWMHLKHLSEHYGHQVTSQILRFAVEQDVSVIVLPRYNQEYSRNVMKGSGKLGPSPFKHQDPPVSGLQSMEKRNHRYRSPRHRHQQNLCKVWCRDHPD